MKLIDILALIHPAIAIIFVFPLLGLVVNMAWQTRQRRLQTTDSAKSQIPPVVGPQHLLFGRWLTGGVVGITFIALAYSIFVKNIFKNQLWTERPTQVLFLSLLFIATFVAFILLYQAKSPLWRGSFATITGAGLVVLGCQEGVFRRGYEWPVSHYYYGMTVALLMIFSVAIARDIYRDRSHRWRIIHTILNCLALVLFLGQAVTGARDLLEIPLSWQEKYIQQCDWSNQVCPEPPKKSQQVYSGKIVTLNRNPTPDH